MTSPALKRATGNWVGGDQFWDREVELSLFMERLDEGAHLLLTAPRRITNQRRQDVDGFLSWLRANSIRHQGKIRLVVTGSIGLEPLVRQAGLSATLNTFTPFHLRPWTREVACGCLQALANGYGLMFAS